MTVATVDNTKLLGFDLKGEPLFDVVVPSFQDLDQTRAIGTIKAVGNGKAVGVTKTAGVGKV